MNSSMGDEEAALSDFEEDDLEAAPVVIPTCGNASYAENLKAALADLETERQARKVAEAAKSESDSATVRLKSYIHEVIRQRDEALRQRDEALSAKEDLAKQLGDAVQLKEDIIRQKDEVALQRDEFFRQKEEIGRARDSARGEIEGVARILVVQAEKVMSMTSGTKSFSGGLPRVPKSTGLTAIALGFCKRVEEVVDEVLKQREDALRRRDELRIQMEQRNFSIAIEVSQLEASITQLKEEFGKKSLELERWQELAAGKDGRIAEIESAMLERVGKTKQEAEMMKQRVEEVENKLQLVNSEIAQNVECAGKAKNQLLDILELLESEDSTESSQSGSMVSLNDDEPSHSEFLAEGHKIVQLVTRVALILKESRERAETKRKDFESAVKMVSEENGGLLEVSVAEGMDGSGLGSANDSSDTGKEVLPAPEALDRTQNRHLPDEKVSSNQDHLDVAVEHGADRHRMNGEARQQTYMELLQLNSNEKGKSENVFKVALFDEDLKGLQQELETSTNTARLEVERLQLLVTSQAKDLSVKEIQISELERQIKDHVETFTSELEAAEEEVARWKAAATAEAAAGAAILEDVEIRNEQIAALNERLAEVKLLADEANSKISSKEEMAMASIAARNAAERSLQIADERATDLRHRLEEMSRQLGEFEQRDDYRGIGLLDMCWPWLCGRRRPGGNTEGRYGSAEMGELLEPLV